MSRIFITGAGLQGGLGNLKQTWQRLCEGYSAVRSCRPDGSNFPEILGAPSSDFDLNDYLSDRKMAKYMNRATALTVVAAGMALEDAGLRNTKLCRELPLYISTGMIAFDLSRVTGAIPACITSEKKLDLKKMGSEGLALCNPLMPFQMLLNTPVGMVSIVYGIGGENFILYPGADQGGVALECAVKGIQNGRYERALVGGGVQGLGLLPILTLKRLGRLARVSAHGHSGWLPCDAGAFVLLESEQAAAARNARPLAELDGIGLSFGDWRNPEHIEEVLRDIKMEHSPDGIFITGGLDEADEIRIKHVCEAIWPGRRPPVTTFDRHLGYASAAAVPYLCALGTVCLRNEIMPEWTGLDAPRDLLVYSGAPEESLVAFRLKRAGGPL